MSRPDANNNAIDAVVTWVDGDDPAHRRKRQAALGERIKQRGTPIAAGRHETRFKDNDELRYCLASIRRFAPWIRYIHLITDNQIPDFLTTGLIEEYRVRLIDHREIFQSYEWALPTFNSRAIETAMWRIPCLADRFLYLNDDFLITQEVSPSDFFTDGKVLLRGKWRPIVHYGFARILLNRFLNAVAYKLLGRTRTMYPLAQMRAARMAGYEDRYFHAPHVPHPVRKSRLARYFNDNARAFTQNIGYKFRDFNQYWPISLANHLEITDQNAILLDDKGVAAINGEHHSVRAIQATLRSVQKGETTFLCLTAMERLSSSIKHEIDAAILRLLAS